MTDILRVDEITNPLEPSVGIDLIHPLPYNGLVLGCHPSSPLLCYQSLGLAPNAEPEPRPEAEAERKL
jgi:hypothetical protein